MSNDDSDHNLIFDPKIIGDRLLKIRKTKGMSKQESSLRLFHVYVQSCN